LVSILPDQVVHFFARDMHDRAACVTLMYVLQLWSNTMWRGRNVVGSFCQPEIVGRQPFVAALGGAARLQALLWS